MNFKYKCLLQQFFSNIPKGEKLNYFFQKNVTRNLPVSNEIFLIKVDSAFNHYQKFKTHNNIKNFTHRYYEFGAGWDLITPITMGLLGFEVTCIDIRKLVFNELITDTIKKFLKNKASLPFTISRFLDDNKTKHIIDDLKTIININYSAPIDARKTSFESNYFDFISSSATFEHIPPQDLYLILIECHRILKQGGILSLMIDYQDHWSYFDKDISIYNFLKFSDKEWRHYNPSLHYQNRMRHKDYINIINKTNFKIIEEIPSLASDKEMRLIEKINIDEKFKKYTLDELSIRGSMIVLKK